MPRSKKRTDTRQEVWLPASIIKIYVKEAKHASRTNYTSRKSVMQNLLINSAKVLRQVQKDRLAKARMLKAEL